MGDTTAVARTAAPKLTAEKREVPDTLAAATRYHARTMAQRRSSEAASLTQGLRELGQRDAQDIAALVDRAAAIVETQGVVRAFDLKLGAAQRELADKLAVQLVARGYERALAPKGALARLPLRVQLRGALGPEGEHDTAEASVMSGIELLTSREIARAIKGASAAEIKTLLATEIGEGRIARVKRGKAVYFTRPSPSLVDATSLARIKVRAELVLKAIKALKVPAGHSLEAAAMAPVLRAVSELVAGAQQTMEVGAAQASGHATPAAPLALSEAVSQPAKQRPPVTDSTLDVVKQRVRAEVARARGRDPKGHVYVPAVVAVLESEFPRAALFEAFTTMERSLELELRVDARVGGLPPADKERAPQLANGSSLAWAVPRP